MRLKFLHSFFTLLVLSLLFVLGENEKDNGSSFQIFISDILINNVNFTFDKNKHFYELTLDDSYKEINISPLLNIWEHYLYKNYSLESEIFFLEHTVEYTQKENNNFPQIVKDEIFLKNFYVHVNRNKYNFFDLPISISIKKNESKKITVYYDKSESYIFHVYNGHIPHEFYLEQIHISTVDLKQPLYLYPEFDHHINYYEITINENVKKLQVHGICHNSTMLINNSIVSDKDSYTYYLTENSYNNVLIVECRQYEYIKGPHEKRTKTFWNKFFPKKFLTAGDVKQKEKEKEKEKEIQKQKQNEEEQKQQIKQTQRTRIEQADLEHPKEKSEKWHFFQKEKANFQRKQNKQEEDQLNRQINKQILQYYVERNISDTKDKLEIKKYVPTRTVIPIKNNNYIKGIRRRFYYFNIIYDIPINVPQYLYNVVDGNTCYLSHKKNKQNLYEYICHINNDEVLFFYNVDSRLFTYIIAKGELYRFVDKLINKAIPYSHNIYLFLQSYSDQKIFKIRLKKKTTFFSICTTLIFIICIITILYYFFKHILKKRRNHNISIYP